VHVSSQRVVRFDLSAAQRAEIRLCAEIHRRVRHSRVDRARNHVLDQLSAVLAKNPYATGLPTPAEVERAFSAARDVADPSTTTIAIVARLNESAGQAREAALREAGQRSGLDKVEKARLAALLNRLPATEPTPDSVTQLVIELGRSSPGQAASVWETLKGTVRAEVARSVRQDQERDELDHAAAIAESLVAVAIGPADATILDQAHALASGVQATSDRHAGGERVDSAALLVQATSLQAQFEKAQYDVHALELVRGIWSELGVTVWTDAAGDGFVAATAGRDRGMWISVTNGVIYQRQVRIQQQHAHELWASGVSPRDSHDALCRIADTAERRGADRGVLFGDVLVTNDLGEPMHTVVVSGGRVQTSKANTPKVMHAKGDD
jgi:hypothetical protein